MSGRRKGPAPNQMVRRVALEHVQDTGATTENVSAERQSKRQRKENYEKLDPPFRAPEQNETPIDWATLRPVLKIGGGIIGFFLTFVLPIVWYASKVDSNVDSLQVDVRDVKQRTEELVKDSIQQRGRLDNLERTISRGATLQGALPTNEGNKP
mgnify:CR=1 FL=1